MEETLCRTIVKTKDYYNTWFIEDFRRVKNEKIQSSEFSGTTDISGKRLTWSYEYAPAYESGNIYLLSKEQGIKQNCQIIIENFPRLTRGAESGLLGQPNKLFVWALHFCDIAKSLSSDGSLMLRFKVTFLTPVSTHCLAMKHTPLPELPLSSLADNFAKMLVTKQFTDLTITVGQQSFRAHKAILVARSTVFAAMFQHDMKESQRNEITITDVEPKVFEEVLRFIYTDKVQGLPQLVHELLAAADKYDLARLKVMCEIQLFEGITAATATKTLLFADLHRAKELKARAIEFLARNLKAVSNWEEFRRENPDLVAEIMKKVASCN
ncbi:speckle-type POZ protein [Culex quinquefasciatus]|uniref:speckle-type POZ protein n=1 Tax=Culex quinquefasciatus TaxID=7176 RepID=UPI0018E313B5|nr:speckle-type POZ protein [Culex quinquefasciatus]